MLAGFNLLLVPLWDYQLAPSCLHSPCSLGYHHIERVNTVNQIGLFASVHCAVDTYCILSLPYSLLGLFSPI